MALRSIDVSRLPALKLERTDMYLELVCRVVLLVTFVAAAVGKARSLGAFTASLREWGLGRLAAGAAAATLAAESVVVLLLAFPFSAPAGYALAAVLLVAFIAGILVAVRTRRAVRCNCFGDGGGRLGMTHVVRNLLLLGIALLGLLTTLVWPPQWPELADGLVTSAFGVLFGIFFLRFEDIAYLRPGRSA